MAALTSDRKIPEQVKWDVNTGGFVFSYLVEGGATIYKGAFCNISASGHAEPVPGGGTGAGTPDEPCLGISIQSVDNSAGADGALSCKILTNVMIEHDVAGSSQLTIGDAVYVTGDQSLGADYSDANAYFGRLVQFISGTKCLIKHEFADKAS